MKTVIISTLVCAAFAAHAQTTDSASKYFGHPRIRLDGSIFQVSYGPCHINTQGDLPDAANFILSSTEKYLALIKMDVQVFLNYKIGLDAGLHFFYGDLNLDEIRDNFQQHEPAYKTSIDKFNDGYSPQEGGIRPVTFKIGAAGFFAHKRFAIVPHLDYLHGISRSDLSLWVNYTDLATSKAFTREYDYVYNRCNGAQLGASLRSLYIPFGNSKHYSVYMELWIDLAYLDVKGDGHFEDQGPGHVTYHQSAEYSFSQKIYTAVVGLTLGGFDMHR